MKFPTLVLLLCLMAMSYALQAEALPSTSKKHHKLSKQEKRKRLRLGFNFMPGVDYRYLTKNSKYPDVNYDIGFANQLERPQIGFKAGVSVCYNFSKVIGLQSGIQYSDFGFKSNWIDARNVAGTLNKFKYFHNYHYIGIPVMVNFTAGKKKVKFIASAGFDVDCLVQSVYARRYSYTDDHTERKIIWSTSEEKRIALAAVAAVGVEYGFKNRFSIRAQPTFTFGALPFVTTAYKRYLWSAGLNVTFLVGM